MPAPRDADVHAAVAVKVHDHADVNAGTSEKHGRWTLNGSVELGVTF